MSKQLCPVPAGSGLKPIYGSNAPTVVEVLRSVNDRDGARRRRRENFGDITFINLFGRKMIMPNTPSALEQLAMNKSKNFANGPAWDFQIGAAFRRGILLLDFEEHRHHRLILQQAFTPSNLKGYMQAMQPMIAERIAAIAPRGGRVALAHEFKSIALDMALEVFVGVKLPREEAERINQAFLDCLTGLSAIVRKPIPGGKYRKAVRGRRVLEEFAFSQLPHKRRKETADLFSVLCHVESEDGARFTDEDVVNHMIFVLFAAHDTSTAAISTMAYHMGRQPDWQQRARTESLALPAELSFEHLKDMAALDLIFKESLRINSPVPFLAREALVDTELDGYFVPKGAMILAETAAVHHNPDVWSEPDVFDPERFTADRGEDKAHKYAWAPFGGGVHKCIGMHFAQMEIKTMMHNMLRCYEWSQPADYVWRIVPDSLADPVGGLPTDLSVR